MNKRNKILSQMFDVLPVDDTGELDIARIQSIRNVVSLKVENSKEGKKVVKQISWRKGLELYSIPSNIAVRQSRKVISGNLLEQKANVIQFNRFASKNDQIVPHLLKSDYVPNSAMVPCADVVKNGELPEKKISSVKIRPSLKKVLDRGNRPASLTFRKIRKEKERVSLGKRKEIQEFERKFNNFFGESVPGNNDISERKFQVNEEVVEVDLSDFFLGQKDTSSKHNDRKINEKHNAMLRRSFSSFNDGQLHTQPTIVHTGAKEKDNKKNLFSLLTLNFKKDYKESSILKPALGFMGWGMAAFILFGGATFVFSGIQIKEGIEVRGKQVLSYLAKAQHDLQNRNFVSANANFEGARSKMEEAKNKLNILGGDALDIFQNLPFLSKISSGKNVISGGEELIKAAQELSKIVVLFAEIENPLEKNDSSKSMTDLFIEAQQHILTAKDNLNKANKYLDKVKIEDLPEEYQNKFSIIKDSLPMTITLVERFEQNSEVFLELLGHNGPRKYLFLFQNNQEMRATGGFIGSYGLLSINNGEIKSLLIDGIFNPDGQLRENIVPPKPIQKISAGWSTHDSNWFPNFPTSAKKIAWFYEKTGGPTVDGIITLTPTVLQKMLNITGPIKMEEYDVIIDENNFVAKTQYEVEINYDKELNQPKKFIADLAPQILNKLFSQKEPKQIAQVIGILSEALKERHILLYSFENDVQSVIANQGWSGEVLDTDKDFLMVVNSNINGFKTDGIIDEKIEHQAQVRHDGSIIDKVTITRKHNGGDSQYEWWNKVNPNYMRVYVPKGSQLISAKGHTREIIESPLDYEKLRFEVHLDVYEQEQKMQIDEETGTTIYDEGNKTVFANWVYVSPKETVIVEYQYLLPFKIDLEKNSERVDTYSLLAQKQSGSIGSKFLSVLQFDQNKISPIWIHPQGATNENGQLKYSKNLSSDAFVGVVFQDKNKKED